jgi:hypothetical protein
VPAEMVDKLVSLFANVVSHFVSLCYAVSQCRIQITYSIFSFSVQHLKERVICAAGTKLGNNGIDCSAVSDMFDHYHGMLNYKVCDCTNLSKEMKAVL